jgi:hypothetical protein|tara:strand:- start:195 stop:455 length:261 start_codon:yes stop_codon:yes gene_type:complete
MTDPTYSEIVTKAVDERKQYVEIARDGAHPILSASGKAAYVGKPKHLGEFWVPVSLLRVGTCPQQGDYGRPIVVPVWFLMQENIPY